MIPASDSALECRVPVSPRLPISVSVSTRVAYQLGE
jgi:hypothetical protein